MKNLRKSLCVLPALITLAAAPAFAQNVDKAIDDFKAGRFQDSASGFYAVLQFDDEPGNLVEAQYGLAKSFEELELPLAAQSYYAAIVQEGSVHPYFDKAVEGLLDVSDKLDDDFKIPALIDAMYEVNAEALRRFRPELLQRIHFTIGRNSFKRQKIADARDFLNTVKEGNSAYPRAQYLLGLIALGMGRPDAPPAEFAETVRHFMAARDAIGTNATADKARELYDLATLGLGRTYYERAYRLDEEHPDRNRLLIMAEREYRSVPRFSSAWSDALFERAWTHTVANQYGKALGALHSLNAPYFKEEFYPEANILTAIIYYYNCQWDRVNRTLDDTKAKFTPMVAQLDTMLARNYDAEEWYALLNRSLKAGLEHKDAELIPWHVARRIATDPDFERFERYLKEIEREVAFFEGNRAFNKSEMGRQLSDEFLETRDSFVQLLGRLVRSKLERQKSEIGDINTRASIVSLETKTAETEWLEIGREIGGMPRTRLPRPYIPDDTFQFWWFRNEYWIDELGFYEFSIKTECFQ
jgi:hypothetical protein